MTEAEWALLPANERLWRARASQHRVHMLPKKVWGRFPVGGTEYRDLQPADLCYPWTPWLILCYQRWMTLDAMTTRSPIEDEEIEDLRRKLLITWVFEDERPLYRVESLGVLMVVYEHEDGKRMAHAFPDLEKYGVEGAYHKMWGIWPGWQISGELPLANTPEVFVLVDAAEQAYDHMADYTSSTDHLFPTDFDASKIRRPWEKGGKDE